MQSATLRLGLKDGTSINNFSELTYQLTVKNLDTLKVDGMALVEGEDLAFERLQAEINGMGTFQLSGSADELDVQINGMGSFDSPELASRVAHVAISGGGNVVVQVSPIPGSVTPGATFREFFHQPWIYLAPGSCFWAVLRHFEPRPILQQLIVLPSMRVHQVIRAC